MKKKNVAVTIEVLKEWTAQNYVQNGDISVIPRLESFGSNARVVLEFFKSGSFITTIYAYGTAAARNADTGRGVNAGSVVYSETNGPLAFWSGSTWAVDAFAVPTAMRSALAAFASSLVIASGTPIPGPPGTTDFDDLTNKPTTLAGYGVSLLSETVIPTYGVSQPLSAFFARTNNAFDRISDAIQSRIKARTTTIADNNTIREALQAQIDALSAAGGGIIYFPAGLYLLDQRLTVKPNVLIIGAGKTATTLKLTAYERVVVLQEYAGIMHCDIDAGNFATEETVNKLAALNFSGPNSYASHIKAHGCYTGVVFSGITVVDCFADNIESYDNISRGMQFDPFTSRNLVTHFNSHDNGNAGVVFGHGAHDNIVNGFVSRRIANPSIWFQEGVYNNRVTNIDISDPISASMIAIVYNYACYGNSVSGGFVKGHGRVAGFTGGDVDGVYPEIVNHETDDNVLEGLICKGTDNTNNGHDAIVFGQNTGTSPTANRNVVRNCLFDTFYSVFRNVSDAGNNCDLSDIKTRNIGAGGVMARMKSATDVARIRNIEGFNTKFKGSDATIAADSTGVKTIVLNHGLLFTPTASMISASVTRETAVADISWKDLWVVAITNLAVTVRLTVVTASATAGAKLRVNIHVDAQAEEGFALSLLP